MAEQKTQHSRAKQDIGHNLEFFVFQTFDRKSFVTSLFLQNFKIPVPVDWDPWRPLMQKAVKSLKMKKKSTWPTKKLNVWKTVPKFKILKALISYISGRFLIFFQWVLFGLSDHGMKRRPKIELAPAKRLNVSNFLANNSSEEILQLKVWDNKNYKTSDFLLEIQN